MRSNIYIFTDSGDHLDKQFEALKIIYDIMIDGDGTIIHYNLENDFDGLTLDSLSKPILSRYYFDYTSCTLDEIDDEIINRYKSYRSNTEDDEKYYPCVIFIDGARKMPDYTSFEDLCYFFEDKLNLLHFLNMYVIIIL